METHREVIECMECGTRQWATVEHTSPFWTWIHRCTGCGYVIQESEWVHLFTEKEMEEKNWLDGEE